MLILKNARMFDGIRKELENNVTIVMENGVIADIIHNSDEKFEGKKVIDVNGAVISPGFIDCHVHFMLDEVPDKERQLNDHSAGGVLFENADSYVALRAVENARKTLEAGFTTVVDGG